MRILHVVPTYLPAVSHGGPIRSVHGLARAQSARGDRPEVFTTNVHGAGTLDLPVGEPIDRDGVPVWYFAVGFPRRLARSPTMARALDTRVSEFDLVHLHSLFLWPTSAAARAARRNGVPYFVSPRGMLVRDLVRARGRWRKSLWIHVVERPTLAGAAALIATTMLEATEARRFSLPLPPIHVVPNGVEPFALESPVLVAQPAVTAALARQPLLLALGRISWKKGLDRLVAALPLVPAATLAMAGSDEQGERARLETLAVRLGVADRLLFLGQVDGSDKEALLRGATALVLPSLSENFGNVVLEAMAAGTPVVVSPGVGLAETVADSGCGLVVEPSPVSLGRALASLLADPESAREMGRRGAAVARARFAWSEVAAEMTAVYKRCGAAA